MSLVTIYFLAVGLGVDAFSVAIGIGATNDKKSWAPVLRLAAAFGIFQFYLMMIIQSKTVRFIPHLLKHP